MRGAASSPKVRRPLVTGVGRGAQVSPMRLLQLEVDIVETIPPDP
jgi:hypothetical protein